MANLRFCPKTLLIVLILLFSVLVSEARAKEKETFETGTVGEERREEKKAVTRVAPPQRVADLDEEESTALNEEESTLADLDEEESIPESTTVGEERREKKKGITRAAPPQRVAALAEEKSTRESTTVGEERREEKKAITRAAPPERGGALLPTWRLVIEPSFEYNHFSGQNVSISGFTIFEAILIGQVSVEKVKRDIYIPALTFRLGIKDSELNVRIPYFFRQDKIIAPRSGGATNDLVEKNFYDNDIGDIEAYYYYHLIREGRWRPWVPDLILRVGGKFPTGKDPYNLNRVFDPDFGTTVATEFPTGTGHWGFSMGGTFVKSVDPAIIFLNAAYYFNFARNVGIAGSPPQDFGNIDLGDSFEYNIGLILALQEKLSLNFSYNQRITGKTTRNGTPLTDTSINAISFKIGATYVISPRYLVDFNVGIGLSQDAPDVSVLVRFPISF